MLRLVNRVNHPRHASVNKLWTLSQIESIGYIESVGEIGIIFKHPVISFRETSSNLSTGDVYLISTVHHTQSTDVLKKYMAQRMPVSIKMNDQLFSLPTKGFLMGTRFSESIHPIDTENITINSNRKGTRGGSKRGGGEGWW